MKIIQKMCGGRADVGLTILRVVVGIVFLVHGIQKLNGIDMVTGFFTQVGIPAAGFFAWVVALVETIGGAALILGVGTHIAAVLLSVVMLVAIFGVKRKMGFTGGYEFDLTLLAALVGFLFQGAGKYSVDAKFCGACSCGEKTCSTCNAGSADTVPKM